MKLQQYLFSRNLILYIMLTLKIVIIEMHFHDRFIIIPTINIFRPTFGKKKISFTISVNDSLNSIKWKLNRFVVNTEFQNKDQTIYLYLIKDS